jgi:hypothetical protein
VDALVFRLYPAPHPGNVVTLVSTSRDSSFENFSYREYLDIREHTKSYDGVIANAPLRSVGFSAESGTTPLVQAGMLVSGNYFHVLGVEPRIGRGFREDEDQVPGRDAVVVLASTSGREFASGPMSSAGCCLNSTTFTVIGVAPERSGDDFRVPLLHALNGAFSTNHQRTSS